MDDEQDAPTPGQKRNTRLGDMYAALGIEDDGDSSDNSKDEDYLVEEEEEEEEDIHETDHETSTINSKKKKKTVKAATTASTSGKGKRSNISSPHVVGPFHPLKRRKVVNEEALSPTGSSGSVVYKLKIPSSPEYIPRQRASKHLEELELMETGDDEIVNVVPPFAPKDSFSSWNDFEKHFKIYKQKNNLKFRVRSSEKMENYNKAHEDQMPTEFEFTHKIFRCTHGVSQKSRSKGHRNRKQRYCKCKARLTVIVTKIVGNVYGIVTRNQNHTHSHPTTSTQASTYLTTKTLPLDNEDREDVKTLVDARVSSSHITNFLNDRIGCKVTPQQTRNLIRSITGQDSAEEMLKNMLHALRQVDGSDVLVMQDQMDATCGIVMQTRVQKMMFEQWGSLVVTTCTGRGFPVLDFICLNEFAVTIKIILEYFKEKNAKWEGVTSVVIDKDFTEWKVLEECFPSAHILLCQFHAISYWKKVMKRPVYHIKVVESEDLLELMMKLLYCHTEQSYEARYDELKKYCKKSKKQAFFAYFEKNWNSCRAMWSNYARGKHFTAGNTTTNRIESNWKYLKMLLGRKTRIDRTIAGLLQHQMTITRQIVTEIGQQHSTSRMLNTIPKFLRAVARRISSHVLERVKKEWERFVNQMEKTTCERRSSSHQWKVYFLHYVYECDELDWTCTCLFYSSNHLPCCHLMHVANQGNGFQALPGMSIDERWSTFEALDFKEELSSAADTLQPIVNMSKLKLPKQKLRLPDETGSTESKRKPTDLETEKEVVFVRLRRNERANQVVLSSAEKYSYAKAMLEPLLQHLSELSSADYYQELSAWKETVDIGLRVGEKGTFVSSNDEGGEDEDTEAGNFSLLDPVEAMGTACLMETLETSADSADITDDSSDGETVPPTQPSEITKETPKDSSDENLQDEGDGKDISIDPKGQGRPRTTTKQLRQTKIATRLAVHKYPNNLTVQLDEFVIWARNTSNLKVVADMMDKYPIQLEDAYLRSRTIQCSWEAMRTGTYMHPFVIPADLTRSMEAAIKDAKNEQRGPGPLADKIKKQGIGLDIVASIDPKLWKFSGKYVGALTAFYAVKSNIRSWFDDRKWLERDWRKVVSNVDLFGAETGMTGLSSDAVCNRHWAMANEVISKFTISRLSSEFAPKSGKGIIAFDNIVGGLCRGWLNDSPVDFCMESLSEVVEQCYVLSSLTSAVGWPRLPTSPIIATRFILHPFNLKQNHWGVIIARLRYNAAADRLKVHVYLYEPLIDDEYHEDMEAEWNGITDNENKLVKEGLRGFVERWCQASAPNTKLEVDPIKWVEKPQQPDYASCGAFVVGQAYSYVTENLLWQHTKVSKDDVQVMRLRMLWMIMCNSRERRRSRATIEKAKAIGDKLLDELK
ncbi:hypothetical protein F443_02848 [Phytophthora nicotianae P1569]|uniref:SWIM-type domain-containing protein n=2 Tax=Phytophthora nicotianae P1569 TaxID=1317065 RepID=V9FT92_PHYNI|nr:hypothetical protein F443_02848 [Phytophthora nicotianae P1569]